MFLMLRSRPVGVFGHSRGDDMHPRRAFVLGLIVYVEMLGLSACSADSIRNGH